MCMLSFIPAGVDIVEQDLLNGGIINADGSGWAIAAHNTILMGKSMKVEEALDEFVEARKQYPDCPALFHSRWATHGTTGVANVHPFLVGGSHKTVVGHNGILPCTPNKGDWRSDTRILADEHLAGRFRRFDKPTVIKALSDYIGKGNKLVILTVDPRYKENYYIINESAGHWDGATGVWHSNRDYIGRSAKYPSYYSGTYWNSPRDWERSKSDNCTFCGYGVIGKAGYCMECGTCNDCGMFRQECDCWSSYYSNFDWDTKQIARKTLDIPTLGYRKTDVTKQLSPASLAAIKEAEEYERAGMPLGDIVDQIDALENEADNG